MNRREIYKAYLESPEWAALRKRAFECYGRKCQACWNYKLPQVHHINYRNLHDCTVEDLVVLCRRCHKDLHKKLDAFQLKSSDLTPELTLLFARRKPMGIRMEEYIDLLEKAFMGTVDISNIPIYSAPTKKTIKPQFEYFYRLSIGIHFKCTHPLAVNLVQDIESGCSKSPIRELEEYLARYRINMESEFDFGKLDRLYPEPIRPANTKKRKDQ